MKYLRWLLFPFSLLYGLVVIIRNWLYDAGLLKSRRFGKPVISVGNLDVGGAGKSPMTEYLIRLLKNDYRLATLSRGYGRKTKGYLAEEPRGKNQESRGKNQESRTKNQEPSGKNQESRTKNQESRTKNQELRPKSQELSVPGESGDSLASKIGDEPAQFKNKFPDITVAVCEKRVDGIEKLLPGHDLIILDDAYQHRAVEPGLSILLFDYNRINESHLLLPAGNMREPFSGRWRAQILLVTKCPDRLTGNEQLKISQRIQQLPYQQLFFTSIAYQPLEDLKGKRADVVIDKDTTVFLLTGIASTKPLIQYLKGYTPHIIHHNYPDHHPFTLKNISKLAAEFSAVVSNKKLVITTEKDAQRLEGSWFKRVLPDTVQLPVFVIPIRVSFLKDGGNRFDQLIIDYVREHTTEH